MNIQNDTFTTKRVTVEALEEILEEKFSVLDHGFVRVIDYMGSDDSIVQAARISYGKGTKKKNEDQALINYLMKHKHTTPFEMCEIKLHVKMPIFVARQWIRHRTANINEYSGRYSVMSDDYYVPKPENIAMQSMHNKQCRSENALENESAQKIIAQIKAISDQSLKLYHDLIDREAKNVQNGEDNASLARELARIILGVNFYTEMYWKIDLHNLLHFLHLRSHSHSQYEIRVYAEVIEKIVKLWVPNVFNAYQNYKKHSVNFSQKTFDLIKQNVDKTKFFEAISENLSKRESAEVLNFFNDI